MLLAVMAAMATGHTGTLFALALAAIPASTALSYAMMFAADHHAWRDDGLRAQHARDDMGNALMLACFACGFLSVGGLALTWMMTGFAKHGLLWYPPKRAKRPSESEAS